VKPAGDETCRDWIEAYLILPNLPGDQAVSYNPNEWPQPVR
jgi:hypothetical protein